ncbi:MAG: hypothetical protein QM705_10125 [Ancrocorticia sp.]
MLGTNPMSRRAALGATLLCAALVLSGCGNPSPAPTGDSSIIVPPESPEPSVTVGAPAPAGELPELPGFDLLFSTTLGDSPTAAPPHLSPNTPAATTPAPPEAPVTSVIPAFDGVLASDDHVAIYTNDLSAQSYEITGYRISSGAPEWSHEGSGILSCHDGDVAVCETRSYEGGVWTTEAAWLLSLDSGGFRAVDVGAAGTFSYVGNDDGDAYFLTWDGTRSVHMTGFDESGVPVVDKNLRVTPPAASASPSLETWMDGSHALVGFPGETPVLYDASSNLATEVDVTTPCISVADGVVCTSSQDPATIIGIDDRLRESWRHTTTAVSLLAAASDEVSVEDFADLFLISQPPVTQIPEPGIEPGPGHPTPAKTAAATPGTPSAQFVVAGITGTVGAKPAQPTSRGEFPAGLERLYATVADEDAVLLALADKALSLPGDRTVKLGEQRVESVDLSQKIAIVHVSAANPSPGESAPTRIFSSIVVGEDGAILSSLPSARVAELFAGSDVQGQQIFAHTFTWQDEHLVFSDPSRGTVAIYKQK